MLGLRVRKLAERGDTIVEVLISIAVVSLILGGAYVTTNKSLQGTRAAQERSDALKLVEGQLETIKAVAGAGTATSDQLFANGLVQPFCMANQVIVQSSDAKCTMSAKGSPTASQPAYKIEITRPDTNTFVIKATWAAIERKGTNSLDMTYRIYQH